MPETGDLPVAPARIHEVKLARTTRSARPWPASGSSAEVAAFCNRIPIIFLTATEDVTTKVHCFETQPKCARCWRASDRVVRGPPLTRAVATVDTPLDSAIFLGHVLFRRALRAPARRRRCGVASRRILEDLFERPRRGGASQEHIWFRRSDVPVLQRKEQAARARHGSAERRSGPGIGEPTDVPKRTPARGPAYWASRVLRRGAGSVEAAE
jgi:hypothetical protein